MVLNPIWERRLISDSNEQSQMDIAPFRNIINEMYAKDTSRKIKSALRTRKKSGKYISSNAPFGYQKDTADHTHLVIDPNTAPVVAVSYTHLDRLLQEYISTEASRPCRGAFLFTAGLLLRHGLSAVSYTHLGFHAITTYRISHWLWQHDRTIMARQFQSLASEVVAVDIHPAATIGCGILLDHATSFVVGETAIIRDNVSILHEVTLGGTGKEEGDRHPIVESGVLIGAGAKILGRVTIGACAKIAASSVVLENVPPHTTVAGVPAVIVNDSIPDNPALDMNQRLCN